MLRAVVCAFLSLTLLFVSLPTSMAAGDTVVRVAGSETMKPFEERLTQWYANKDPLIRFKVSSGRLEESFAQMVAANVQIVQSDGVFCIPKRKL